MPLPACRQAQGIAAMQSINVVVINPWFLVAFLGTAQRRLMPWRSAAGEARRPQRVVSRPGEYCRDMLASVFDTKIFEFRSRNTKNGTTDIATGLDLSISNLKWRTTRAETTLKAHLLSDRTPAPWRREQRGRPSRCGG